MGDVFRRVTGLFEVVRSDRCRAPVRSGRRGSREARDRSRRPAAPGSLRSRSGPGAWRPGCVLSSNLQRGFPASVTKMPSSSTRYFHRSHIQVSCAAMRSPRLCRSPSAAGLLTLPVLAGDRAAQGVGEYARVFEDVVDRGVSRESFYDGLAGLPGPSRWP